MSKKHRPKFSLRPDALAWLARKCSPTQWQRCLDLYDRRQLAALLTYLQSITDPEVFAEFEEKNLDPETLAERRKAEAEKIQAEENEKRTIRFDGQPAPTHKEILSPAGWRPLGPTKEDQEASRRDAALGDLAALPEAEFDDRPI